MTQNAIGNENTCEVVESSCNLTLMLHTELYHLSFYDAVFYSTSKAILALVAKTSAAEPGVQNTVIFDMSFTP